MRKYCDWRWIVALVRKERAMKPSWLIPEDAVAVALVTREISFQLARPASLTRYDGFREERLDQNHGTKPRR